MFGPTGQGFQRFQATIDSVSFGTFDGQSSMDTYDTLLFFVSGLSEGTHQVVLTNQDEGGLFALDYFVAVSSASSATNVPPNTGGTVAGGGGAGPSTPAGPGPTAVFGNPDTSDRGSGATAGVIGGVLGGLFSLVSPHMHRHRPPADIARCFSLLPGGTTSTARTVARAISSRRCVVRENAHKCRRRVRQRTISGSGP